MKSLKHRNPHAKSCHVFKMTSLGLGWSTLLGAPLRGTHGTRGTGGLENWPWLGHDSGTDWLEVPISQGYFKICFSPPARWGLLDFMSVACSSPPLLSSSSCSTATLDAQCSLSDLNHDHPRPVFPAGPQPRPSPPSVPYRTSTTTIHAQCSLPDLDREYPRQVFPAGPHVGRYGTKNVQKKVRKNVRQVCYILLANSRVCGRVTGAMPLLTLQVAKFEAISLNRWQSHWGGQRHFHFCTFGAVCKDAWDRQHLTASYYKLLEVISCWIDAWDSQHHTGFLLCITAMVAWWICDIGTFVGAFEPSSTRSRARGRMDIIIEEFIIEDLPDRMPEDMPDKMPNRMSEDMPDRMPNRMPDRMPDRMPEDMS